jgi:hypothetical protein
MTLVGRAIFASDIAIKRQKRHCDNKIKRHFSGNNFSLHVNLKSQFMGISADFEKQ